MRNVYTVEIMEAEMQPAYARNVDGPNSMTFVGKGHGKTLGAAKRNAEKAFRADERKTRNTYWKKYGWDNATPIYGHVVTKLNGAVIREVY